jgi:DNA-directed RNA polymerase subunit K/omega
MQYGQTMQARKRSRTRRAKVRRASDPWKHPKAEIAFREINDGRKRFNMPPYSARTCHLECCSIA